MIAECDECDERAFCFIRPQELPLVLTLLVKNCGSCLAWKVPMELPPAKKTSTLAHGLHESFASLPTVGCALR